MAKSKDEWVPSVLGHAILQLLTRSTQSGYDLKKRFHGSVGHGWHAYDTQIYRELRSLEENGYVSGRVAEGRSGPQRRLYSITDKGVAALGEWLASPLDLSKIKDEFALRVWTTDLFPDGTFIPFLNAARKQWTDALAHQRMSLQLLTEEYGDPTIAPDAVLGRQLAIEQFIALTEARLAWADRAQKVMRRRATLARKESREDIQSAVSER